MILEITMATAVDKQFATVFFRQRLIVSLSQNRQVCFLVITHSFISLSKYNKLFVVGGWDNYSVRVKMDVVRAENETCLLLAWFSFN